MNKMDWLQNIIITLLHSFSFWRFLRWNPRLVPVIYQLIDAVLLGNIFEDPSSL